MKVRRLSCAALLGVCLSSICVACIPPHEADIVNVDEAFRFTVKVPAYGGDEAIKFGAEDVQGLGLSSDVVAAEGTLDSRTAYIEAGLTRGEVGLEYCFAEPVTQISDEAERPLIEAGECIKDQQGLDRYSVWTVAPASGASVEDHVDVIVEHLHPASTELVYFVDGTEVVRTPSTITPSEDESIEGAEPITRRSTILDLAGETAGEVTIRIEVHEGLTRLAATILTVIVVG